MGSSVTSKLPVLLGVSWLVGLVPGAQAQPRTDERIRGWSCSGALKQELARSRERLRLPKEDGPYFIRYLVRDYDESDITTRFGALLEDDHTRARQANVEARVGDYLFDNTADDSADKMFDMDDFDRYEPPIAAPIDGDTDALRATLWLQTDIKYKRALSLLHKKRGSRVTRVVEDETMASFSKEQPSKGIDAPVTVKLDRAAWVDRLRRVSAVFKTYPEIFDSRSSSTSATRPATSSPARGASSSTSGSSGACTCRPAPRAADGLLVPHYKSFYGASEQELPDEKRPHRGGPSSWPTRSKRLCAAPMIDPYTGPAILLEEAAGVFFHEALGHRLEGERQNDDKEGRTFKGQIGKPVLPDFLSMLDDPTLRRHRRRCRSTATTSSTTRA